MCYKCTNLKLSLETASDQDSQVPPCDLHVRHCYIGVHAKDYDCLLSYDSTQVLQGLKTTAEVTKFHCTEQEKNAVTEVLPSISNKRKAADNEVPY